ncbi:MAG: LapA family protein [Pseudomonadota bacterium]
MFYIRVGFLALIAIVLVTIALANRDLVTFTLLPQDLGEMSAFNWSFELPLYGVIFLSIVGGILIGFVWEWLREFRYRSMATKERRHRQRLEEEVRALKTDEGGGDDVLALLEDASRT